MNKCTSWEVNWAGDVNGSLVFTSADIALTEIYRANNGGSKDFANLYPLSGEEQQMFEFGQMSSIIFNYEPFLFNDYDSWLARRAILGHYCY